MKLHTLIPVTHTDVAAGPKGGTREGVVILELEDGYQISKRHGLVYIDVPFKYIDDQGNILPTRHNGTFELHPKEEDLEYAKTVSRSVNALIPATDNIVDRIEAEIYAVATAEMCESYVLEAHQVGLLIEE